MDLGLALLSNSGYNSRRRGFGEILGTSMLQSRQMAAEAAQQKLREQYMQAQIQAMQQRPQAQEDLEIVIGEDGKPVYVPRSQAVGKSPYERPSGTTSLPATVQEYEIAKRQGYPGSFMDYRRDIARMGQSPSAATQRPAAIETYEYLRGLPPDEQTAMLGSMRAQTVTSVGGVPTVVTPGGARPLSTLEAENTAARDRAAATASGAALASEQAKREATFETDMSAIEDEIIRTQRLKTEFEEGKYQTGPLAGRLPAMRTNAQNLRREAGKDVIRNISSATFGALSEGEREFLKNIGISENVTEESNVAYLDERLATLKRARDRLRARPPLTRSPGAGARQGAGAPQGTFTAPPGVTIRMLPPPGK
jgi:hypothetical protein